MEPAYYIGQIQDTESILSLLREAFLSKRCLFLIEHRGINLLHTEENFEICQRKWPCNVFDGYQVENHPNNTVLIIKNDTIQRNKWLFPPFQLNQDLISFLEVGQFTFGSQYEVF